MSEREKIAAGWDNFFDLAAWSELDLPNFHRYKWATLSEWYEYEGEVLDSTSYPKRFGKPRVVYVFAVLTQAELQVLRALPREVTLYAYDKTTMTWTYFNGECFLERLTPENWRKGYWVNIRLHVTQLTEIIIP